MRWAYFPLLFATLAAAQDFGYTDTPMLPSTPPSSPYHVHDPARPHPAVVTPSAQPGGAPSDAIVLFDGHDLSPWTSAKLGTGDFTASPSPAGWKVGNGYFEVAPRSGDIATKEKFGDVQLHVEWSAPAEVRGSSQGRGNSGIFLQGRYEVQVLDAYQNPTYADGQAGAIYGQWPPLANPARKPGEWQSYDIVFEAPHFGDGKDAGKLTKPAYLTVFLNGVLLHNRQEVMGPTVHRALAKYAPQPPQDSLVLQDHGNPVRYRNIWIRRLHGYDQPEK
jgi:hypothetical protein